MDSYRIAICLKNNPSKMIGTFFANEDGMVKLENAFFESNSKIVFPTIVISESDIVGVMRVEDCEVRSIAEKSGGKNVSNEGLEHVDGEFKIDSEISNAKRTSTGGVSKIATGDCGVTHNYAEAQQEGKDWNQFEANSKLFNIDGKFDEQEYMEVIDRTCEVYKANILIAKKIENEIMHSATNDQHILEERGVKVNREEDAYSSVIRKTEGTEDAIHTETSFEGRKDKAMKLKNNTVRRKMVIEIEGLSHETGTESSGFIDGSNREDKRKGEVGRSIGVTDEKKMNGSIPKSVTYGWMNTQFESIDQMLNTMKSKFVGKLANEENDQKWGAGINWKTGAKSVISRSMKTNKAPLLGNKQIIKKGSTTK
ncbi:hypothetical protein CWI42_120910 [Ordospora colligata]|uniref:LsmAD domain-containing protein n=1 Tax=Ordospora colligata OC4 TaxID=1354746 RepID=A0A0B2UI32_9MICR|nr:uncharacterized protein M896_120910 [Ordospora colligata OC4]KHN68869.1 hypothetical protein M896_120910 [Ordospora colligata OC4]TBU13903.1 hypothetical protein CWI40_120910 [Ordospora colligata]TBU14092.1 hypothetical protein CWI41_120910 [Ordospora colligata]TBU17761.1 hypothetical protein CWI42_120910 [Ordospora colligata]